jgi:hypothetical protein
VGRIRQAPWIVLASAGALCIPTLSGGCGGSSGGESPSEAGSESGLEGGEEGGLDGSMPMTDSMPANDGMTTGDVVTTGDASDGSAPLALSALTKPMAFAAIFDAVPNSTGTTVYFTALDTAGNVGVYSVPVGAAPAAATALATGAPFIAPFGIAIGSNDGTVYVADPGAVDSVGDDRGSVFSLATTGSPTPIAVGGTPDYQPRGITVGTTGTSDTLFFTGNDQATGAPGVFSVSSSGGTVANVIEGAPFVDPSGVAVTSSGDVYVLDTVAAGSHRGAIIKGSGGTASAVASNLWVGYPAGIALNQGGTGLVVSGLSTASGPDTISSVTLTGTSTPLITTGLANLSNAAGLHRASNANVYAFVDSAGDGTDAVYVIK